jgi:hypothetical protein
MRGCGDEGNKRSVSIRSWELPEWLSSPDLLHADSYLVISVIISVIYLVKFLLKQKPVLFNSNLESF